MKNLKKINYPFNSSFCKYFLKKDGSIIYYPNNRFNNFYCLIQKYKHTLKINFPNLYGKDNDEIVLQLLIYKYLQKKNIKYIKLDKNFILLFDGDIKNIEDTILNLFYIDKHLNKNISINDSIIFDFIFHRLLLPNKITNNNIMINIFYEIFNTDNIKRIKKFKKIFNINLLEIPNYHELYLVLKKIGFVKKFYKDIVPNIIKNYKKVYNKLLINANKNNKLSKFKTKYLKKIKNFNDIDIIKLVDNNIIKEYNKIYIKNKFIELSKKYKI
jgi:hypothetical protein